MPHEIDRVLAAVQSRTWLIDEQKAAEVVALLAVRAETGAGVEWAGEDNEPIYAAEPVSGRRGTVHVLNLQGTIMPRAGMLGRMSGASSLDQFGKAFDEAAAGANAQAIVLDIDSPGGAVDMVAETAEKIYRARRAGRPIIAVANTMAASAAYWIASAADEVVVTPSGHVGSIGVYGMHDDISAALEKMGVKRTMVRSGARKAEGAVGPLDEAALKHRQASADYAYDMFTRAVARNRGVDLAVVRADPEKDAAHMGGGRAYNAKTAVSLRMADRVATFEETLQRVASGRKPTNTSLARRRMALL
ncbi:S49 family peptidase [Psychromarinibacter halotolerans]|uniref:S49 family peptidase n=1 Tax=Psychromarinibacter halotolerans TaxID=1775175 RepID=A0ABV7GZB1_9RHOB|nr:S49 family peptidase [Psychromarinibacter halotolerans]MDF0598981.1 S49 family peptidase [Psychromarinibacter halotolerans]